MTVARRAPLFIVLAGAAALLTGCGGGSAGTGSPATSPTSGAGAQGAPGAGQARLGGGAVPGAAGLVAAVDGSTLQVQGNNAQTAVTWTAATTFTDQAAARLSDVVVGSCVMVRSSATGEVPESSPIAAASVAITRAVDGRCDARMARGGQGRPDRSASASPSGGTGPSDRPTGGQGAGRRFGGFGGVFGVVKSVSGASFTVSTTTPARPAGASTGSPSTTSRTVQVNTTKATVFTRTVAATAKVAKVGTCVTALGKADDTGAIAATTIAVRPAVNGSCVQGFGRRADGGEAGPGTGTTNG